MTGGSNAAMWQQMGLVALAGAAGTLARYGLSGLVQRLCGPAFPWGTLAVNVVGCFLFGLVWILWDERGAVSPQTRIVLLIGFMGAFTTFSTFAFETNQYLRDAQWTTAAANFLAHNVLGVGCLIGGMALGRWLGAA